MAKHCHVYANPSKQDEHPLPWIASRIDVFESNFEDGTDQDDALNEVAAIQPVYVIPHSAVQEISQWSQSKLVSFGLIDGCR